MRNIKSALSDKILTWAKLAILTNSLSISIHPILTHTHTHTNTKNQKHITHFTSSTSPPNIRSSNPSTLLIASNWFPSPTLHHLGPYFSPISNQIKSNQIPHSPHSCRIIHGLAINTFPLLCHDHADSPWAGGRRWQGVDWTGLEALETYVYICTHTPYVSYIYVNIRRKPYKPPLLSSPMAPASSVLYSTPSSFHSTIIH